MLYTLFNWSSRCNIIAFKVIQKRKKLLWCFRVGKHSTKGIKESSIFLQLRISFTEICQNHRRWWFDGSGRWLIVFRWCWLFSLVIAFVITLRLVITGFVNVIQLSSITIKQFLTFIYWCYYVCNFSLYSFWWCYQLEKLFQPLWTFLFIKSFRKTFILLPTNNDSFRHQIVFSTVLSICHPWCFKTTFCIYFDWFKAFYTYSHHIIPWRLWNLFGTDF